MQSAEPFPVYVFWDPAIDIAQSNLSAYLESRDPKHLVFYEKMRPQTFWCRPIPNMIAVRHLGPQDENTQRVMAFRYAVYAVDNAYTLDGRQRESRLIPTTVATNDDHVDPNTGVPNSKLTDLWTDTDFDNHFDPSTVLEVGEVCRARAFLPKQIAPVYQLPPTSLQLLNLLQDQLAERARSLSNAQETSSPPADSTSSTNAATPDNGNGSSSSPANSDATSDAPGDAPATASATAPEQGPTTSA